jgi:4'-phosphopantetheinyl transferase EntD
MAFSPSIIVHAAKQRQAARDARLWHSAKIMMDAALSPCLGDLFPAGALAAELREPGCAALLLPGEAEFLGGAVHARAQEFAAGRLCARRLLAEFGIHGFPIAVAEDRQPLWPEGIVGSITHTTGFCAAVVARKDRIMAIGMDCELAASVKPALWAAICTPGELRWLNSLPEPERRRAATLIFSAKEAFYKCQYPLTGERLRFHDVSVEPLAWGDHRGELTVRAERPIAFALLAPLPRQGRYLFHEQFVTTGMAAVAQSGPPQ